MTTEHPRPEASQTKRNTGHRPEKATGQAQAREHALPEARSTQKRIGHRPEIPAGKARARAQAPTHTQAQNHKHPKHTNTPNTQNTHTPTHLDALGELPGPRAVGGQPALRGDLVSDRVLGDDASAAASAARGYEEGDVRHRQPEHVHADGAGEDEVHGRAAVHVGHEHVLVGGHLHRPGGSRSGGCRSLRTFFGGKRKGGGRGGKGD